MNKTETESIERGTAFLDEQAAITCSASKPIPLTDFYAHLPDHRYIHVPTRELWPAASVDGSVPWPTGPKEKPVRPSNWLDSSRAVEQMTWAPGLPTIIRDKVVQAGGWVKHDGASVFNLYRPPKAFKCSSGRAGHEAWLDLLRTIYPDDADHVVQWLAHRVQHPEIKINHALVLGGAQGIGKDTILEPVKHAVGHWNWSDMLGVNYLECSATTILSDAVED